MKSLTKLLLGLLIATMVPATLTVHAKSKGRAHAVIANEQQGPPEADLVIDRGNYRRFEKSGLHLFPDEVVEFKIDHSPPSGPYKALSPICYEGRKLYRARELGAAGTVTVEAGPVIPFYLLWVFSAMARDHTIAVIVDQAVPTRAASSPALLK